MTDVTLHLGDCLEYMRGMEPGSVDVIADPPYGIGKNNIVPGTRTERNSKARTNESDCFEWDELRLPEHVKMAYDISGTSVFCGGNYYGDVLPISRGWIVWDKENSGNFSDGELIYTSKDCALRFFRYMWNGMIKQKPEQRYHPTQKPLALMLWIIENYTSPGATILDPFAGSGTTGVACVQLGRNFIGIEKEPQYFEIMQRRIKQAQMQLRLEL